MKSGATKNRSGLALGLPVPQALRRRQAASIAIEHAVQRAANDIEGALQQLQGSAAPTVDLITKMQETAGNAEVARMLGSDRGAKSSPKDTNEISHRIAHKSGRGRRLDRLTRSRLEPQLGVDLSDVNIHTDSEADDLARSLSAEAFTTGRDIFFGSGKFDPLSEEGFRRIAHETMHVAQQAAGPVSGRDVGGLQVSDPTDRFERGAEQFARGVSHQATLQMHPRPPPLHRSSLGNVQRCGPTPCDCPAEEKASAAEEMGDSHAPIQRLAAPTQGALVVQRAPLPLVPFGDFDLMFNPSAKLSFTPPGGTPQTRDDNSAAETFTFDNVPRGSSGTVTLDVAMQWFNKAGPGPGPGPKDCDLCGLLARKLRVDLGIITLDLLPAAVLAKCRELVKVDPNKIIDVLFDLQGLIADPCGAAIDLAVCPDFILAKIGCEAGKFAAKTACRTALALGGGIAATIQGALLDAIREVRAALGNLPPDCKKDGGGGGGGGGQTPPTTGSLAGSARSILKANFTANKDGTLSFTGLPPAPSFNGEGAQLDVPVDFVREPQSDGGSVAQQPRLRTTKGRAALETRAFTANIKMQPAPAPVEFQCTDQFFPFIIAKDKFEDEDGEVTRIHMFFHGLHPKTKEFIRNGQGLVRIVGRASATGSVAFNTDLSQKRAKRVEKELQMAAGSDAHIRTLATGFLAAAEPGEVGKERRADVFVEGTLTDDAAQAVGSADNACVGGTINDPKGTEIPVVEEAGAEPGELPEVPEPVLEPV